MNNMKQKIPNIKDCDIGRIIKRDFPNSNANDIRLLLHLYNSESKKGGNRVWASILKLSNGDIDMLKQYIEKANNDFRDVIMLSEYPNYSKHMFGDSLSKKDKNQLIVQDWEQYELWLLSCK